MAVIDSFAMFSGSINSSGVIAGQTVTGTGTTVLGTNSYDTTGGSPTGQNVDLGKGSEFDLVFRILTAFVGATSITFQFISADDAGLTTNVTVLGSTGALAPAVLTAGAEVVMDIPPAQPNAVRRYVGVQYVIVGTGSAGAVTATLQPDHGDAPQPSYASGFSVL